MKPSERSFGKMERTDSTNAINNNGSNHNHNHNRRIRPRPVSANARSSSVGHGHGHGHGHSSHSQTIIGREEYGNEHQNQGQGQGQGPGRSLLPIWALATANLMDHSTTATGVSSSSQWKLRHQRDREREKNAEKSNAFVRRMGGGAGGGGGSGGNADSNTNTNAHISTNSALHVGVGVGVGDEGSSNFYNRRSSFNSGTKAMAATAAENNSAGFISPRNAISNSNERRNDEPGSGRPGSQRQGQGQGQGQMRGTGLGRGRTKQWIRSGNKWIIGDDHLATDTHATAAARWRKRTGSASSASSIGTGAGGGGGMGTATGGSATNTNAASHSPLSQFNNSPGRKIHPTAVSSYGTSFVTNTGNASSGGKNSPGRKYDFNSFHTPKPQSQSQSPYYDTASSISNFAASSASGLYTRRRMATTPGGFPYMPALHLLNKKSSGGGGTGTGTGMGISNAIGIDGSMTSGATSSLLASQRFQHSYLLRSAPATASSKSMQQRVQFALNQQRHQQLQSEQHRRMANRNVNMTIESQPSQKSLFSDDEYTFSSYLYPSNSGYDSEGNCEERLKEWKEKFVQKFINEDDEDPNSSTRTPTGMIRRVRSLDSDCDSESNLVMDRLNEWKVEQYKNVKMHANVSTEGNHSNSNSNSNTKRRQNLVELRSPPLSSRVTSLQQQQHFRPQLQIALQLQSQESFSSDNGYESGSNSYNERLKEWKQQQYRLSESTKTGTMDDNNARISTSPPGGSDPGYDSETSRQRRVKEWKDKFAFGMERFSSTQGESGAAYEHPPTTSEYRGAGAGLDTIHSSAKSSARRGRKVPGGGIFPVTSPQRKQKDGYAFQSVNPRDIALIDPLSPNSAKSLSRPLPPLTPPLTGRPMPQNASTPKRANGTGTGTNNAYNTPKSGAQQQPQKEDSHVVLKATKFLLGLSPGDHSDIHNDEPLEESSTDCFMSSLGISSPCKVIPSLQYVPSTDSTELDDPTSPRTENDFPASSLQLPKALNLWKTYNDATTVEPIDSFHSWRTEINLHSWDNCLYVRAEGARSGRICLTTTHLIFIYEDDISDSLLARYGWSRNHVDEFLIEMEGPSSRGATPVNVPLDESGEGGGVELIESDGKRVTIMDLIENGFGDAHCSHAADFGEQKLFDHHEKENVSDGDDTNVEGSRVDSSRHQSSYGSSGADSVTLNKSIIVPNSGNKLATNRVGSLDKNTQFLDEIAPISLSSSSFESMGELDDIHNEEQDGHHHHHTKDSSLCRNDSNEDVMSNCIIRAINEEAHMRCMQEDERTASYSILDRDRSEMAENGDQDYTTLYGNQTNVSSFSDVDMDIDPDQERSLYISDEDLKRRYIGIKWPLNKLSEVFDRRYMMKEVGLEIFGPSPSQLTTSSLRQTFSTSASPAEAGCEIDVPLGPLSHSSLYLVIPGIEGRSISRFRRRKIPRRETFVEALKEHASQLNDANWQGSPRLQRKWQWRRNDKNDPLSALTRAWRKGHISNYDYLLRLNAIAGRSFHDPGNYPIMPWVLSNFTSTSVPDLSDERNYRDLSKPMGALDPDRLLKFQEKYASLCTMIDTAIPPFMYGSHYSSTGGVVLHYLVRVRPFAGLHRQLQGGQFDLPDRLFRSVSQTWDQCSRTSPTEVKELTPEWYSDASFLKNTHEFNLGTSTADGAAVSDVTLPPWADNDATKFIQVMRNALESDFCSTHLHSWIDLIFGCKVRGPEAEKSNNIFYHLSYYDSDDLANIKDDGLRTEIELHIADFGSCPTQLFLQPHPNKKMERKGELQLHMSTNNGQQLNSTNQLENDNTMASANMNMYADFKLSPRRRFFSEKSGYK